MTDEPLLLEDSVKTGKDPAESPVGGLRGHRDKKPVRPEAGDTDQVLPLSCVSILLLFGFAMGDGDMPAETGVDLFHHLPEQNSVRTRVLLLGRKDGIVDHLVQESVFKKGFVHVDDRCDAQGEIVVAPSPEQFLPPHVAQLSQLGA